MIRLNETDEYAAEVPFTMPLATDPLTGMSGYSWVLGDVKMKLPTGGWFNVPTAKIFEKGFGRFVVRLTAAQCITAGIVSLVAIVSGYQPCIATETIGSVGGDIALGDSGYLMAYLPSDTDPIFGTPATGSFASLAGATAQVCYQNAVYASFPAASVVEFGNGLYGIPVSNLHTALRGKIFYYLKADGFQRYEDYSMVLDGTAVGPGPDPDPGPTPVPVAYVAPPLVTEDFVDVALGLLLDQYREPRSAA